MELSPVLLGFQSLHDRLIKIKLWIKNYFYTGLSFAIWVALFSPLLAYFGWRFKKILPFTSKTVLYGSYRPYLSFSTAYNRVKLHGVMTIIRHVHRTFQLTLW